jgi:membrane-associated phospholipid phosphatase
VTIKASEQASKQDKRATSGDRPGWSRRSILRLGGAAALGVAASAVPALVAADTTATQANDEPPIEPSAGNWKPWVLTSGRQLRLPAPPDAATTRTELNQLRAMAAQRDTAALDLINYWDSGSPGYRWNDLAITHTLGKGIGGGRASRLLALLNIAIADATIAAWDSKYTHNRQRPSERDPQLTTALPVPNSPSYPCEHSAAAGAAAAILTYVYPADATLFAAGADEVGRARQLAGLAYPSDVAAGMELGRAVADLVIERAKADGSDKPWTGTVPTGDGKWIPAANSTPAEVTLGTWKTWALASGDQVRPGPPLAFGSAQLNQELAEVKAFPRTNATNVTASFWEYYGGLRGHINWQTQLRRLIAEYRLDANPPRAARAYALLSVAYYEAFIACFDAKYTYWAIRPFQLDKTLTTTFVTPNHPSYPSGHSTLSGAASDVLAYLFPREAGLFSAQAEEAAASRLWSGIHFRSDNEIGLAQGREVAKVVITRAKEDGAG